MFKNPVGSIKNGVEVIQKVQKIRVAERLTEGGDRRPSKFICEIFLAIFFNVNFLMYIFFVDFENFTKKGHFH